MKSVIDKAIDEMRDKNTTGDNDIPGAVLQFLREDGLKILTQLINNIYDTGECQKDFIDVTMIILKQKPKARK